MKEINNNIEEKHVGFNVAKLLKQKGFDVQTPLFYASNGKECNQVFDFDDWCRKPTQSIALEWIRVNWSTHIYTLRIKNYNEIKFYYTVETIEDNEVRYYSPTFTFNTPEEAIEAALEYVLTELF